MVRNSRLEKRSPQAAAGFAEDGRALPLPIATKRNLLTGAWTSDVAALESAIGRFKTDSPLTNDCQVAFFEIAGDTHLHINVTLKYPTKAVDGWAGPGSTRDGFVHNRTFAHGPRYQVLRHIREMVFAART